MVFNMVNGWCFNHFLKKNILPQKVFNFGGKRKKKGGTC